MKSILFTSVFCFFIVSCSQNHNVANDLHADQLEGDVAKLTMTFYNAVEKSGKIDKDKIQNKYIFSFNHDGNITEQTEINMQVVGPPVITKTIFSFNNKGQRISARYVSKLKPYLKCIYDNDKRLKEVYSLDDKTGAILKKTEFKNKDANCQESYEYLPSGELVSKTINIYEGKRIKSISRYNSKGALIAKNNFVADASKRLERTINMQGNQRFEISYKYSNFDNNGNYLTSTTFYNGKPFEVEERIIEYR